MPEFRTMITLIGQQKIAVAIAAQTPLVLTQMAVGNSSGIGYDPVETQEELLNEVYRDELDSVEVLTGGVIVCQMTIPITEGGWHIREAGVFDDEGDMIAVVRVADRYKPLPSSGQADDLTIMLKLDVGNVGAVTWAIDPQKKIHHGNLLHPYFQAVEAMDVGAPPGDPVAGATWVIPAGATGAWTGLANRLAQWAGVAWSIVQVPDGHIVSLADGRIFIKLDGEFVLLDASEEFAGLVRIATQDEVNAGIDEKAVVTPARLRGKVVPNFRLALPSIALVSGVKTAITDYGVGQGVVNMPSSSLAGGVVTIGAEESGLWLFIASMRSNTPSSRNVQASVELYINGSVSTIVTTSKSSVYTEIVGAANADLRSFGSGTVQARVLQRNTDDATDNYSVRLMGVRVAA